MYEFAANKIKLQRAIASCGKDATEEKVKAAYIKLNGQVLEVEEVSPEKIEEPEVVVEKESIVKKIVKKVTKKK